MHFTIDMYTLKHTNIHIKTGVDQKKKKKKKTLTHYHDYDQINGMYDQKNDIYRHAITEMLDGKVQFSILI